MMTPLRWVTGGGDQEKFTCLCPETASNISGAPVGAVNTLIYIHISRSFRKNKYTPLSVVLKVTTCG